MVNWLLYACSYFSLFTAVFFLLTFLEHSPKLRNPRPNHWPTVSVIVPAYNEERHIATTLRSLLALRYKGKYEIIVIDDGSTDRTLAIAQSFRKYHVRVFTKRNTGKGDSLNFGLRQVKSELVACLDADSMVDPNCLARMVGYFNDSRVMAVTPSLKIHQPHGTLQRVQQLEYLFGIYLRKVFSYLGSIHVTPGPFSVFRKSFFRKYGGYDTTTLTEDIEIAMRIQSKQYLIENSIDANVWTVAPETFRGLFRQRLRWYIGFLDNVVKYKHMFGNHRYGNLGMFFLPGVFVSNALVIALFGYLLYRIGSRSYQSILDLIAIRFDIWPMLNFNIDLFYLNLDALFLLSVIGLCTGLTMLLIAKRCSRDTDGFGKGFLLHLFLYLPLYAVWWVAAGACKLSGKQLSWGPKVQ